MGFLKPYDSVHKVISLPRWQRDFYERNRVIKLSTIVQEEITLPFVKTREPKIYEKYSGRKINEEIVERLKYV